MLDCDASAKQIRDGILHKFGMESLFVEYGVEFFINGHEHNYERLWDIRDFKTEHKTEDFQGTVYPFFSLPLYFFSEVGSETQVKRE